MVSVSAIGRRNRRRIRNKYRKKMRRPANVLTVGPGGGDTQSTQRLITVGTSANKLRARRNKQMVKDVLFTMSEKKYHPVTPGATLSPSSTSAPFSLTDIAQITSNSTDSLRDGDQIYLTSIEFNWQMTYSDAFNVVRCIIFQWLQSDASGAPSLGQILQDNTSFPYLSPYAHDYRYQYRILYDKTMAVSSVGNLTAIDRSMIVKGFRNKIQYSAGTNNGVNKIYALFISDSGAISHPLVTYSFKINFRDF